MHLKKWRSFEIFEHSVLMENLVVTVIACLLCIQDFKGSVIMDLIAEMSWEQAVSLHSLTG